MRQYLFFQSFGLISFYRYNNYLCTVFDFRKFPVSSALGGQLSQKRGSPGAEYYVQTHIIEPHFSSIFSVSEAL